MTAYEELGAMAADLNEDELYPILLLARRIHEGKKRYGALSLSANDQRVWLKEALDEQLDNAAYLAWHLRKSA